MALAPRCGFTCQPWQTDVLMDLGARTQDGSRYAHPVVGLSVPRQAGKSVVGIAWALLRAIAEGAKVLWTDHNYSTTCEMYRRFRRILGMRPADPTAEFPELNERLCRASAKTAQEAFFLKPPRRGAPSGSIHFATRTKSAALGYSFDMVVYDEAQELTEEQEQAILPTTTSGELHDLQLVYLGTPTRPSSAGTKFRELRSQAVAGEPDTCWWEWGVSEVGDVSDESRWPLVNPSLPDVADVTAIRIGMRRLSEFAFAQEYLGYWSDVTRASALVPLDDWEACASPERVLSDAAAYGVKFSPDGQTVAVAVAVRTSGATRVELAGVGDTAHGMATLVGAIARVGAGPRFVVDGRSGAQALVERLGREAPDVDVSTVRTGDAISAAETFVAAVRERSVTWYRPEGMDCSDRLSESVLSVTRRRIGSSGGWGFGGDDPAPAEAAALALWASLDAGEEEEEMEVYF